MTDIQATAHYVGNRRVTGRATGRDYGRIGHGMMIMADPQDVAADDKLIPARYGINAPGVKTVHSAAELGALLARKVPTMPVYAPGETFKTEHSLPKTIERLQEVKAFDGPYLSVVTGTYNRLKHLKQLVKSVRVDAVMYGIPTEIVVVDGGSNDGTLEWLSEQTDTVTIAQGELLGAIPAFNAGGFAARGKYVVFANDDVYFQPSALMRAIVYMDSNPVVGQGAFYQDRPRGQSGEPSEMHVLKMRGREIDDPEGIKKGGVYYAQVGIVPKWLGDMVGWWGDFGSRTYGGDNYLSARIWEKGLRVDPMPGACIHDQRVNDELRRINTEARQPGGHPDSKAYYELFPLGPRIGSAPLEEGAVPKETTLARVLYVPILSRDAPQKRGLLDAMRRRALVCQLDYRGYLNDGTRQRMITQLNNAAAVFQPDMFLFQIQDGNVFHASNIKELRQMHKQVPFINFNGDKMIAEQLNRTIDQLKHQLWESFHLIVGVDTEGLAKFENGHFWAHGYEEGAIALEPDKDTPKHDVVFFGTGYSDFRREMERALRKMADLDVAFYGTGWDETAGNTHYDFLSTGQIQRNARVVISDAQWGDVPHYHSNRCIQSLASGGALLLQQWFAGMESLGFIDGETCVVWRDIAELVEQVEFWAKARGRRVTKRRAIAQAGADYARKAHSYDVRIDELITKILPILGQKETG